MNRKQIETKYDNMVHYTIKEIIILLPNLLSLPNK